MPTEEEQMAAKMERMSAAIVIAIEQNGGTADDARPIMGSLGATAAAIAFATGRAAECLAMMNAVASMVVSRMASRQEGGEAK